MKCRSSRQVASLLGLSVLSRIAVAFYLGNAIAAPPVMVDQRSYHVLAVRLLEGYGFSFPQSWYPFTLPDAPTAFWSFLYPLFLAAIYALFGVQPLAARLVQAVLGGVLLPWMVYRLARRLFPDREPLAVVATGCAAFYAFFMLYAATLMTENFYIVAVLWAMERAIALTERPSLRQGTVLGLALGLATLLRQSILPWVAAMFTWLLWAGWRSGQVRRMIGGLGITALLLMLVILPFTIRNYIVYGEFLLLNSNAGYAMYSAQHPMHGTSFQEFAAFPPPENLEGLNEAQLDRELMRRGISFVLAEPGRYLLLSLSRVPDYYEFWPSRDTTLLHNLGRVGSFGLYLPFMLYGTWLAIRQVGPLRTRQAWLRFSVAPLALILLFMVFYPAQHILTWAMPRYRLPVDAVAMPFAALALTDLAGRLTRWRKDAKSTG